MSAVLVDTHTFLWSIDNESALGPAAEACLQSDAAKFISHAAIWEMSLKLGLGKLRLTVGLSELVALARRAGVNLLPIELDHLYFVQGLANHHRDPFDRLMVAQCHLRSLAIISRDQVFDLYGVRRIW